MSKNQSENTKKFLILDFVIFFFMTAFSFFTYRNGVVRALGYTYLTTTVAWLAPFGIPINTKDQFSIWSFNQTPSFLYIACGFLVAVLCVSCLWGGVRGYRKNTNVMVNSLGIFFITGYIAFLLGLGVGRGVFRGPGYLEVATYYFSFSSF